jgi:hypothetical protein
MSVDILGHRYDDQPIPVCTRCGIAQIAVTEHKTPCPGTPGEQRADALAGMLAAVEYARTMFGGMAGGIDPAGVQEGLDFIRADCERGRLDILGALASVTLRAASLASATVPGMTVESFLDLLEAEARGWGQEDFPPDGV